MVYTPKGKLEDIVKQGVVIEILDAEEAIKLYEVIGNHKEALIKDNFDNLFGVLQIALVKNTILALNKIYERPKRYPLRSIPAAIKILKDNFNELKIRNREQLEEKLINWVVDRKCLISLSDAEITNIVAEALSAKLPSEDEIKNIKDVRDKRFAHHELIDETKISSIMWPHLEDLLARAKKIVGVIGNHYLGDFYEINGEYVLSYNASETSRSLVRLLKKAGIMSIQVYGIPNCSTCKKALTWLQHNNIDHEFINTKDTPPTREMIQNWVKSLGFAPMRNTSGQSYRALGEQKKIWNDEQWIDAFTHDAMLLKRPLIVKDGTAVLVGFKNEAVVQEKLGL